MRFGWQTEMLLDLGWTPLRTARFWAGMSQDELAEIVGSSRETISSLERRASIPSITLALAIARALDTSVEELFGTRELV